MSEQERSAPRDFGWCLIELMGHRQRIGRAKEEEIAGGLMLRIDIPVDGDSTAAAEEYVTEYYGTSSIYALRPVSEQVARDHYARADPRPARPADYRPSTQIAHHDEDDLEDDYS